MSEPKKTPELKPCPFCGRKADLYVCDGSGEYHTKDLETTTLRGRKMTHCQFRCQCGIMTKPYLTRRGLWNAWNRRAGGKLICQINVDGEEILRKALDKTEVDSKTLAEWIELANGYKQLEQELAAVKRERDAAVADLELCGLCKVCKHMETKCNGCSRCKLRIAFCDKFEWRGVSPDTEEQDDEKG